MRIHNITFWVVFQFTCRAGRPACSRHVKKTILFFVLLFPCFVNAQQDTSMQTMHTQFRRGTVMQQGYQTYEQKYAGKNLIEEKRRLYPLGYGTNHLGKVESGTGVWTELNPKVTRVDYLGIHFVNIDTGWAVGDLGALIKTTDGGINWTTEETNTTTPILKVNSYDGQIVIAAGFSGLILRSTDGGESWTQITSGVTGDLWGLQMINDTLGWACGKSNSLIKTTDAGLTWTRVFTPGYTSDYWWIDFLLAPSGNENYGFIAANGKVIRTTNGGNSWDIIQAGDNQALYSVDVIDSLHIAAAGYGGTGYTAKNLFSNDGGNSWIEGQALTTHEINCVKYINPDTGYITMSEIGMYKTTNRGQEWTGIESIRDIGEFEFQLFPEQSIGYSAGTGLKLFKAEGDIDVWHKLIINDDFTDVFFTSEQKGFVISQGMYGLLFRTTDGGTRWDTVNNVPGGNCITFTDSLTGYIGASDSKIYKTRNGGENWYPTNGIITRIAKIFFINPADGVNPQTGWAVGETRIYKTTDGGENWFEQVNRPGAGFTSVSFVDSLYGWASLGGWRPYKTTDGGLNWIEQMNLNFYNTYDVYFTNHDTGWIIDIFEHLNKTTNGGYVWITLPEIISPFNFNFFPDPSHWIINGSHRYITTDNGNDWIDISNDVPTGFNKFQAPTDLVGYAASIGGLILKYIDTIYTPVELTSLLADVNEKDILLTWTTSTETNNKGFSIERKNSKVNKIWITIGFIEGKGTTTFNHSYSFIDKNVERCKYLYRLKQIDFDGSYNYSKVIEVDVSFPSKFTLEQNYPNPFNPETKINYTIPEETNVSIKLYDITGRELKVLVNEKMQPGYYTIKLKGGELSSGVYFCRLVTTSGFTAVKKLILLK